MRKILNIIRLPNLLILAFTLLAVRHLVFIPIFSHTGQTVHLTDFQYVVIIFITELITVFGYIINDLFDIETDTINKPEKVYIGKLVCHSKIVSILLILSILIFCCIGWISVELKSALPAILFLLAYMITTWYAMKLKKSFVWGNLAVASMSAGAIVMVWIFENIGSHESGNQNSYLFISKIVAGIGILAFLLNLISEIVKDMEDETGDRRIQCRSLVIVKGIRFTKTLLVLLAIFMLTLLFITQFELLLYNKRLAVAWMAMGVQIPLLAFLIGLSRANKRTEFHNLSTLLKVIMFCGILTLLFAQVDF